MRLTWKQKHNLGVLAMWVVGVCALGAGIFGLVALYQSMDHPAAVAPAPVAYRQVTANKYEQINFSNDPTLDHYCIGSEGFFWDQDTENVVVTPNDSLCK